MRRAERHHGNRDQRAAERDHGRQDVERPVYVGGHQVFFEEELEPVGHGLPHAERANPAGSPAILNAAHQFALQQHGVGHGPEKDGQHHGNLQTTEQEKDQEAHAALRAKARLISKQFRTG